MPSAWGQKSQLCDDGVFAEQVGRSREEGRPVYHSIGHVVPDLGHGRPLAACRFIQAVFWSVDKYGCYTNNSAGRWAAGPDLYAEVYHGLVVCLTMY